MDSESASEEEILCYKLRAEKSVALEINLMEWSPSMDVIAIAFSDHSIALNRLSWQRVWSVEPSKSAVSCFTWRPDGRVLAAGFEDGKLLLLCVENGKCLHQSTIGTVGICSMQWREYLNNRPAATTTEDANDKYKDHSVQFLPKLFPLDQLDDRDILDNTKRPSFNPTDCKKLKTLSNTLNVLIIGDKSGRVHLFLSGILYTAIIPLSEQDCGHVISMRMSHDLSFLGLITAQPFRYRKLDLSLLGKKSDELQYVTLKYGQTQSILKYIEDTIQSMSDSWEDSLLVVDRKVAKYAQDLPDNLTVADEFIILLGCGKAREELQTFLVDELTANGVKKLGLSLEMSYDTIRKLLINHTNRAIQTLDFHLCEVLGIANWTDKFGELGLPTAGTQKALQALGSFALKAQELLFLIDQSLCSMKVFFMWLYSIILKLAGDSASSNIGENFTVEDLGVITEFLESRFKSGASGGSSRHDQSFSLERVGQYFLNEDLKFVMDDETPKSCDLENILAEAGISQENVPWIIKPCPLKSLRQLFNDLKSSIASAFECIQQSTVKHISQQFDLDLSNLSSKSESISCNTRCGLLYHGDTTEVCYCSTESEDMMLIINEKEEDRCVSRCGKFYISSSFQDAPKEDIFRVINISFYDSNTLSVVFTSKRLEASVPAGNKNQSKWYGVAQLPISALLSIPVVSLNDSSYEHIPRTDIGACLKQVHHLRNFAAKMAAFSGPRRLAAVVSSTGKRVRLFDVDFDQSDEDMNEDENL